jgi:phage terminase large subunit-like protein
MAKNYEEIAKTYALDVISGRIPAADLTKMACQRHLNDLQASIDNPDYPFVFNPVLEREEKEYRPADRVCGFIEQLKHTKGAWKGRNIDLEPWQVFCLAVPFGWIRKGDLFRRFTEIYLEVPRKNGKSIIAAGIGLYMLLYDGEGGAEVYSGASSKKQAIEVFAPAWLMCKGDSELQEHFGINIWGKKPDGGQLTLDDYSKFEMLIGNPPDGSSPSCALVDEYHEHPDNRLFDTMETGMGARAQPMLVVTTTAGTDISSACYDKRLQVESILKREEGKDNDSIFGIIYTINEKDKWDDIENWKKANPNYGVSVFEHYLIKKLKGAIQQASKQNITRCKHLNQWMNAGTAFFNMLEVEKSVDHYLKIEDFKGKPCWVGLDIASKKDLAAVCAVFKENHNGKDHYYWFAWSYLPEKALEDEKSAHYRKWKEEGWLEVCGDARLNFQVIENRIKTLAREHDVMEVPHDPWNAAQMAGNLLEEKIQMVEIPQTVTNFTEPTKEMDALISDQAMHFPNNPVIKWCLSNVVVKYDKKDNVFPYKERPEQKIDVAIGGIMALGRAMTYKIKSKGNDGSCVIF